MFNKIIKFILDVLISTITYLLIVAGGLTLFLVISPLFGYLGYSDEPGVGWHDVLSKMTWEQYWMYAFDMLGFTLFYGLLISIGGLIIVLLIRTIEYFKGEEFTARLVGGFAGAFITAYFSMGAGWYFALGTVGWFISIALGIVAGAWVIPRKRKIIETNTP